MKSLILLAAALLPASVYAGESKSIYGPDNRQELYQVSEYDRLLAKSVASFWKSYKVTVNGSKATLATSNFGTTMNLCPDEPFRDQPMGAFCSGSLVGDDLVMTAGHCIRTEQACSETKLVFGFAVSAAGAQAPTEVPAADVYSCKRVIKTQVGPEPTAGNPAGSGLGPDYAIIQLDRKVTGRRPLRINRDLSLKKGQGMFVIGHPVGLPLKVAGDATVRDTSPSGYFVADLDTFGGNSGSPVFNARTKLIEGILVRGDTDFVPSPSGNCKISYRVAQNAGRGEDVTKMSVVAPYIPVRARSGNKDLSLEYQEESEEEIPGLTVEDISGTIGDLADRFGNISFDQ